jgi:hypothetical protein
MRDYKYNDNVYYNNIEGLSKVGGLEEDNLSHEFNILLVIKHDLTGRVFYAADSGCSCPTPFEDCYFNGPDDTNLDEICIGDSLTSFQREVERFPSSNEEREDLIAAVKGVLKAKS